MTRQPTLGPHEVDFSYWNPTAKSVFLAGSFNGWNTTANPMQLEADGEWHGRVMAKPGHHQYKFIADGKWLPDPANSASADDLFGGRNSVITINPGSGQDGAANRRVISAGARRLFLARNFVELENRADRLRRDKTLLPEGKWELTEFYDGLKGADFAGSERTRWDEIFATFDAWHEQYPGSIIEPVARAHSLVGYAWQARGSGWASEVKEDGWKLMEERLGQARSCLEEAAKLPRRCPEWYAAMQSIALGQGWKREENDHLFEEAVAQEPTYYDYYFRQAYYLVPRWHGKAGEWERFAEEAPAKYDKEGGQVLYTRIAWSKDFLFGNLFLESAIKWPRMRDGFRELIKRRPDSVWNKNAYAHFACLAGDHGAAAEVFKELGQQLDYDTWSNRNQFEAAKRWAVLKADSPFVRPVHTLGPRYATRPNAVASGSGEDFYYAGYADGVLLRWNPRAGREVAQVTRWESGITKIAVALGGRLVACALEPKDDKPASVRILDGGREAEVASIGDWKGRPLALAWSADGSKLAVVGGRSSEPGDARIWDAKTGKATAVPWPAPKHLLITVALSPDGRLLMTNDDWNLRVWDLTANKSIFRLEQDTAELIRSVAFSPDGRLAVAITSRDWESDSPGVLLVWNTADWSELKRIPLECGGREVVFSPDGGRLAATRLDNTITVWSTSDWSAVEFLPMGGYVAGLAFGPGGEFACATFSNGLSIWNSTASLSNP